jgi:hypothetical protein
MSSELIDEKPMRKAYMHTIDDKPAFFSGEQICFLPPARTRGVLRYSYEQIKTERRKTIAWRKKMGFRVDDSRYGHRMFYV